MKSNLILNCLLSYFFAHSAIACSPETVVPLAVKNGELVSSNGVRVRIEHQAVVLERGDGTVSVHHVSQQDWGPLIFVSEVSTDTIVAIGRYQSFFLKLHQKNVDVVEIPKRYKQDCGWYSHWTASCPVQPAVFSPNLGGVVTSGWLKGGSYSTMIWFDTNKSEEVRLANGTPLVYLADHENGWVSLISEDGTRYQMNTDLVIEECK